MKREDAELLLSRALDGEASVDEQAALELYLSQNPEAADLKTAWESISVLLNEESDSVDCPSVEDAWQDIAGRIEVEEQGSEENVAVSNTPTVIPFPRWVWGGAAAAAIVVLASLGLLNLPQASSEGEQVASSESLIEVEYIDTEIEDATPVVYVDEESGWTVVWVMEPEDAFLHDSI